MGLVQDENLSLSTTASFSIKGKLRDYGQLMKPNLSLMVVFSSVIGYLLAPEITFIWKEVMLLLIGGLSVTMSANIINQIIEKDSDKFMKRTANRPLPDHRMGVTEAWVLCVITGIVGLFLLGYFFNTLAAIISFISILLYGFLYTPMKKISPIATFVGAIPGALPPLIGWVAATGSIDLGGAVLFLLQFFWQFPHFWAIAWVGDEGYKKAGISLLPSKKGKTPFTGLVCIFYSLPLIPLAMVPNAIGMTGKVGMWIAIALAALYILASFAFYNKNDRKSAKQVMYASFIYLPVVLLAFLFDKI
ncbi:MAG TPA: heme o synthase [Chitinophagaceae bacterium]|nr:heme o synthase [Chitinophagaceae bacterium]